MSNNEYYKPHIPSLRLSDKIEILGIPFKYSWNKDEDPLEWREVEVSDYTRQHLEYLSRVNAIRVKRLDLREENGWEFVGEHNGCEVFVINKKDDYDLVFYMPINRRSYESSTIYAWDKVMDKVSVVYKGVIKNIGDYNRALDYINLKGEDLRWQKLNYFEDTMPLNRMTV